LSLLQATVCVQKGGKDIEANNLAIGKITQIHREKYDEDVDQRVVLVVTPNTGNENLREIGAIGSLLIELVQEVYGFSGVVSVERCINGVRVSITPEKTVGST
jgi:hypothetical protein